MKPTRAVPCCACNNASMQNIPVYSSKALSISIRLAEPSLFLRGSQAPEEREHSTAMLRGTLSVKVNKATKIRSIGLKFGGKARIIWPDVGIPPEHRRFSEEKFRMQHAWNFFDAQSRPAGRPISADSVSFYERGIARHSTETSASSRKSMGDVARSSSDLGELRAFINRRLSSQVNRRKSGGGGAPNFIDNSRRFEVFQPGNYVYDFELPIGNDLPESINVQYGSVKWELEALIGRVGWFCPNLLGKKEVTLVRVPGEDSIERTEPIVHRKVRENCLRYEIVISGKCFALGSRIPIAFMFTPLVTVRCLRVEIALTEEIERYAPDSNGIPSRSRTSIGLLGRDEDGTMASTFPGSSVRTFFGGEPDDNKPEKATPQVTIAHKHDTFNSPEAQTEMVRMTWDCMVQLPSCDATKLKGRIHIDAISKHIQVRHWMKVTMSLAFPDFDNGPNRKHQTITVNFPIRILSCHATPANIDLPAYSGPDSVNTINYEYTLPLPHSDSCCDSARVQVTDCNGNSVTPRHPASPPAYESLITNGASAI